MTTRSPSPPAGPDPLADFDPRTYPEYANWDGGTPNLGLLAAALTEAGLTPAEVGALVELDEGIWWSNGLHEPTAPLADPDPEQDVRAWEQPVRRRRTAVGRGAPSPVLAPATRAAVALVARAGAALVPTGRFPLFALHLRMVCWRAWELTWDHTALIAVIAAAREAGRAARDRAEPEHRRDLALALDLLGMFGHDLRVESAASTSHLPFLVGAAGQARDHCEGVRARAADGVSTFAGLVTGIAELRAAYLASITAAAEATADFLAGDGDDLDRATALLADAEAAHRDDDDPKAASELRAHRFALDALRAARTRDWLHVDHGRIVMIFPFGIRAPDECDVVATVKQHGRGWKLGGIEVDNAPTQLLLIDDMWRGEDPLERRYEGTQLDLPTLVSGPLGLELSVSMIISELGNHHIKIETTLTDADPARLALLTWLAAPEFGNLVELGNDSGLRFSLAGPDQSWPRLSDVVEELLTDTEKRLRDASQIDDLRISARPGMFHVLTIVDSASARPRGRSEDAYPLADAGALHGLFGTEIIAHPIPSGLGAVASWALYEPQGTLVPTAALLREVLLVNGNHTLLSSMHSPTFMVDTVAGALVFVASLDGLFAGWHDDLSRHFLVLRFKARDFYRAIDAQRADDVAPEGYLATIEDLELEQIRLRRFTNRTRLSLLFVSSPALVASPGIRQTIDDLLLLSPAWRRRTELTETAEQVLGDRLGQLIEGWARRKDEVQRLQQREREQALVEQQERQEETTERRAQILLAGVAGAGFAGLLALLQSGFGWARVGAVVLTAMACALAIAAGVVYSVVTRRSSRERRGAGARATRGRADAADPDRP